MKATLQIDIEFESWFEDEREPKAKEDWANFFQKHLMPEASLIGIDDGENQDMVSINRYLLEVKEICKHKGNI